MFTEMKSSIGFEEKLRAAGYGPQYELFKEFAERMASLVANMPNPRANEIVHSIRYTIRMPDGDRLQMAGEYNEPKRLVAQ